ncbi:unnamed protein product [Amaranthus hypochondriacus]
MYTQNLPHEAKQKSTSVTCASIPPTTISKRRNNKHNTIKMVQQAYGDRILTDKWNWRKYGKKVIKGSKMLMLGLLLWFWSLLTVLDASDPLAAVLEAATC